MLWFRATDQVFKRGMRDVNQHYGKKHLHRDLAEYDFGSISG
jgi:hypothetical protein